ncbi:protein dissatisfaction-like [Anopheles funestus]|uniref:protein dissatisfaction-like n=1 Tax=Anopheles funestus TaxID=62324 RepID=UPI0020C5FDFE|nr:protein dissatisfaction-like [Anopheles funestus]
MVLAGSVPTNASTASGSLGGHAAGGLMSSSPHSHVALISAVTPGLGFSLSNGSDVQPSLLAVDPEEDSHHSYHHGMHMAASPHHHLYHHHHHHHDYHHHAAAAAALLGGFTSGSGGVGLVDCVTESNNCADREDSTGFISVAGTAANSAVGNYCLSGGVDSVTGLVHSVTTATTLASANDGDEAGTSVESGSINGGSDSNGVLRSNDRSVSSSSSLTLTARTAAAAAAAVAAVSNHHHHLQQLPSAELPYHHHHRPLPMDVSAL